MSPTIGAALIALVTAVVAAWLTNWLQNRYKPSRVVQDSVLITDNQGKVIRTLRDELDRLEDELTDARQQARVARDEAEECRRTARRHAERIAHLEAVIKTHGLDPDG